MNNLSDDELWIMCLKGKRKAFGIVYRKYYLILQNYGYRFSTDIELIRDTIQDLFLKMMINHRNLSRTVHLKAYLLKAFRYKLLDSLEKKEISKRTDLTSHILQNLLTNLEEPEEHSDKTNINILQEAYEELSPKQKEIIYLYYICEIPHKEIVRILNIRYQSSKNLLHRSVLQLREIFLKRMKQGHGYIEDTE